MRPRQPTDSPASPSVDVLAALLDSLKVDSSALFVFEFSHPWGFSTDFRHPFSWTVLDGTVWVLALGREPLRLDPGDTIVLPRGADGQTCLFLSAPDVHPFPSDEFFRQARLQPFSPGASSAGPRRVTWGGTGPRTRIVSWAFGFKDRRLGPQVEALPAHMVVRSGDVHGAFVEALLNFPFRSDSDGQPGYDVVAKQTAQLLLTYLVRAYALQHAGDVQGWLAAVQDRAISRALALIHGAPERPWTVAGLAQEAGLSRSAFAARFATALGQTPAQYVRAWRMHLAREALAAGRPVTALAEGLGYRSEAAFRSAFKRSTGQQPRQYRKSGGRA